MRQDSGYIHDSGESQILAGVFTTLTDETLLRRLVLKVLQTQQPVINIAIFLPVKLRI